MKERSIKNLKPFKAGPDERRNTKGQPRKIPALDQLLADVLGEEKNGTTVAKKILIALSKQAMRGNIRACEVLLERAFGKPKTSVDLSGMLTVQGPQFDYTALTDEDLQKVTHIISKYQTT
jgi:hypothetical protein